MRGLASFALALMAAAAAPPVAAQTPTPSRDSLLTVARALMAALIEAVRARAATDLFLEVDIANKAARALMDDDYNMNPAIFPDDATVKKLESDVFLGTDGTRLRDEAWTRVLAA